MRYEFISRIRVASRREGAFAERLVRGASRREEKAQSNRRVRDAAINIVRSDKMSGVTHHSLNLTLA